MSRLLCAKTRHFRRHARSGLRLRNLFRRGRVCEHVLSVCFLFAGQIKERRRGCARDSNPTIGEISRVPSGNLAASTNELVRASEPKLFAASSSFPDLFERSPSRSPTTNTRPVSVSPLPASGPYPGKPKPRFSIVNGERSISPLTENVNSP